MLYNNQVNIYQNLTDLVLNIIITDNYKEKPLYSSRAKRLTNY